jgi:predicted nucleic acid-binding protein
VEKRTVVDAGPIIALLIGADKHHGWAREAWGQLEPPLHTCEAVLSEAQYVVKRLGGEPLAVLEFLQKGAIHVAFSVEDEVERLLELQRTYADVPMSLADACLVRMTELHEHSRVMTTDSDFRIYRRNRRQIIPLLAPPGM